MVRKRRKKRVKVEKPKASKSASNNKNDHGVSTEELEASRKLKQDNIDAQLVHVYNLDSIQQVRDMRIEADGYGVKLETIFSNANILVPLQYRSLFIFVYITTLLYQVNQVLNVYLQSFFILFNGSNIKINNNK